MRDIICILDRSGSMYRIWSDARDGLKQFIEEQRKNGPALLTVVVFNDKYEYLCQRQPIDSVDPELLDNVGPGGTTALHDALGSVIDQMGDLFRADSLTRPEKVVMAIVTDGQENASEEYTKDTVRSRIQHQKVRYGWDFIYFGANQDAFAEGGGLGIPASMTRNYAATSEGTREAYSSLSLMVTQTFQEDEPGQHAVDVETGKVGDR